MPPAAAVGNAESLRCMGYLGEALARAHGVPRALPEHDKNRSSIKRFLKKKSTVKVYQAWETLIRIGG